MAGDLSSNRRLATVLVDQGLASAAWYVPVLLVGRTVAPAEFGVFLIGFGALATAVAASRAMFGVVVGMDATQLEPPALRRSLELTSGGVTTLGAAVGLALAVGGLLVPGTSLPLLFLAAAAPVVLTQDLGRYTAVAAARPRAALVTDVVWCAPPFLALALDLLGVVTLSSTTGLTVWLLATMASVATASATGLVLRPRYTGLGGWLRSDRRRRDLGSDSLLSGIVPLANGWGAALVGGATSVAAVRGAAMLFAPVMMLTLVLTLAAVPEARRRPDEGARRLMVVLTMLLTLAATGWGLMTLVLPDKVGRNLIGDSWLVAEPVVPWVMAEYVGVALWSGGAAMLRYASDTRRVLGLRLTYAPFAVVLPVAALAANGSPQVFAATLAVLAWVIGPAAVVLGWRAMTRAAGDASTVSA